MINPIGTDRRSRLAAFAAALALSLTPGATHAQGSRLIITVRQTTATGAVPAAGAAVCLTVANNTKLANAQGVVTFDNVPRGVWSAIAWKKGFKTRRADISVPGTGTVRASMTLSELQLEASFCILPAAPPPTTSVPPLAPGKVRLHITVLRNADGTPLQGAFACVGAGSSNPDSYAHRAYTDAAGQVSFDVDAVGQWYVTAKKTNYTGMISMYSLPSGTYGIIQFRLTEGSQAGATCP